ncbi:MAG: hypothetical protein E7527_01675 [Ruminococcaceae bacterium]|nr:hypothetical protein [Oscillospiraceae bacterium]
MKKFLSLILCVIMLFSVCALAGCGAEPVEEKAAANVKFGAGAVGSLKVSDATDKKGPVGTLEMSYATVLVDADGKITACALDAMKMETEWKDGKFVPVQDKDLKSKYEQKDAYNMVAWGGSVAEWYAQADTLETLIIGKKLDEVKALVVEGYKPNADVQAAGCTIAIGDLVKAVENAYNNAKTEVAADATLSIAGHGTQKIAEIIAKYDGQNKVEAYMSAAAKDKDGKILAIASDCMMGDFRANAEGKVEMVQCDPARTKRQQGDEYNMVDYGGAKAEWYVQADSFDKTCIGKTAAEIAAITAEAAGCTITVDGFVAAASKL